jgi:2,5-dioxopentanoate dehydrogenase
MKLTGNLLIGVREALATRGTLMALNPATNANTDPEFALGGVEEVNSAVRLADEAFDSYDAGRARGLSRAYCRRTQAINH